MVTTSVDGANHVVTSLDIAPGNYLGHQQVPRLYHQHKEHMAKCGVEPRPERAVLDSAFDVPHVHELFGADGVRAFIAPRQRGGSSKVIATDLFKFNDSGELVCPAGAPMRKTSRKKNKSGRVLFEGTRCEGCELLKQCTTRNKRRVKINPDEHLRRQRHLQETQSYEYRKAMIKRLVSDRIRDWR